MKVYSGTVKDAFGAKHSQRYLLTAEEYDSQMDAGVLPTDTCEVIGMRDYAQVVMATYEVQAILETGGRLQ